MVLRAVWFVGVGHPAQITAVAMSALGPGQMLIKIGGTGVCHSDLHVMEEGFGFSGVFTLGHAQLGEGVTGFKEGDAVAVDDPWGRGHCHACQAADVDPAKLEQAKALGADDVVNCSVR
jgi:alcohol dehydrogenase, propanol-preferring